MSLNGSNTYATAVYTAPNPADRRKKETNAFNFGIDAQHIPAVFGVGAVRGMAKAAYATFVERYLDADDTLLYIIIHDERDAFPSAILFTPDDLDGEF